MAIIFIPFIYDRKQVMEIETDDISDSVFREVVYQGLKVLMHRGQGQVSYTLAPEDKAKARQEMLIQTMADIKSGKIRYYSGTANHKEVTPEVMRKARMMVKIEIKDRGEKISSYSAKDITQQARKLIADGKVVARAEDEGREYYLHATKGFRSRRKG